MPIIDIVHGIFFVIYTGREHPPPHVHVKYGEYEASMDIKTGEIIQGSLPRPARRIAQDWLKKNRLKVLREWERMEKGETPQRIK